MYSPVILTHITVEQTYVPIRPYNKRASSHPSTARHPLTHRKNLMEMAHATTNDDRELKQDELVRLRQQIEEDKSMGMKTMNWYMIAIILGLPYKSVIRSGEAMDAPVSSTPDVIPAHVDPVGDEIEKEKETTKIRRMK